MPSPLEIKRQENHERREREQLLQLLPDNLTAAFEAADFIYSQDYLESLPLYPWEITDPAKAATQDYTTYIRTDFDHPDHVREFLTQSILRFEPPALCWLGQGPVFRLTAPLEARDFAAVPKLTDLRICLADERFTRGFVFSQYLGYLPGDRATPKRETVYELVYFSSS